MSSGLIYLDMVRVLCVVLRLCWAARVSATCRRVSLECHKDRHSLPRSTLKMKACRHVLGDRCSLQRHIPSCVRGKQADVLQLSPNCRVQGLQSSWH